MTGKKHVDWAELLQSQVLTIEALVHLLEREGVLSKLELLEEIKTPKQELADKRQRN